MDLLNFYWEQYWKVKFIHDRESKYQIEEWCAIHLKNHSDLNFDNDLLSEVIQICKNWILHDCLKEIVNDLEQRNVEFIKTMCFGEWWDLMLEEYMKYRWTEELKEREVRSSTEKKEEANEDLLVNKSVIESIRKGVPQVRDVDNEMTRLIQQYYKKSIRKELLKELNDCVVFNEHELMLLWQTFPDIYAINTEDSILKNQKQLLKVLLDKTLKYIVDKNGFTEEDNQFLKHFNESSDITCLETAEIFNKLQRLCTFTRNLQKQTYSIDLGSFLWSGSKEEMEISIEQQNRLSQIRFSNVGNVKLMVDYSQIDEEIVRKEFLEMIESMYKYVITYFNINKISDILENDNQIKELINKPAEEFDINQIKKFRFKTEFYNIYFHIIYTECIPLIESNTTRNALHLLKETKARHMNLVSRFIERHNKIAHIYLSLLYNFKKEKKLLKLVSYLVDIGIFKKELQKHIEQYREVISEEFPEFCNIFETVKLTMDAYLNLLNQENYKKLLMTHLIDTKYGAIIPIEKGIEKTDTNPVNSKLYTLFQILKEQ